MGYRKPYYNEDHKLVRYGIGDAVADAATFIRRFFAWRNIRHAFAGVIKGARGYAVFYAALILIQSLFWTVWLICDSRIAAMRAEADSGCDWNVTVEGLTHDEWVECYNGSLMFADEQKPSERGYVSYTVSSYYNAQSEVRYRVRARLISDSPAEASKFTARYGFEGEAVTVTVSERTEVYYRVAACRKNAVLTTVGLGVLSAVILLLLFLIRTNQFKFTYGIYMAFGAGFEKLLETAAWEMFAVSVLTFVPAALFSVLLFLLVLRGGGGSLAAGSLLSLPRIAGALCWTLSIVFVSVIPAVRILSASTPVKLLSAADNSNYVSSPRVSFRIFGKSFPFHYECFSFLRLRKYYIAVLSAAVLFTTLFSSGLLIADMRRTEQEFELPQFTVTATEGIDVSDIEVLDDIEGLKYVRWSTPVSATACASHAVLTRSQARSISGDTVNAQQDGMVASNGFRYIELSEELLYEVNVRGAWDVAEGDLSSVLSDADTAAVSLYVNNRQRLNIHAGDTLILAALRAQGAPIDYTRADKRWILSRQIADCYFVFYEVTVGAVVDTGSTGDEFSVVVSPELFSKLTGRSGEITSLELVFEPGATHAQIDEARDTVSAQLGGYEGFALGNTGRDFELAADSSQSPVAGIIYGSVAVMLVSPLVWMFAQIHFGYKRRKEMYILSAMGAADRDLSSLFLWSGALLSALACVFTLVFTSLLRRLIFFFINEYLPSLGFGRGIRYDYVFPWWGLLVCVAVSSAAAVISTYLPFRSWVRDRDLRRRAEAGADGE